MACRNGPYQVSSHIYTDAEEYRLDSNPEALSVADLFQEQLIARSTTAGEGRAVTNNIIYANTVNVQIHNHAPGNTSGSSNGSSSPKSFEAGEPPFAMVSHASGVDFGSKFVKRYYSAEKHVDLQHNLVTYTQTRSTTEKTAHFLTLGLSRKRATHVIILFEDSDVLKQLTSAWPSRIHLNAVEIMIRELGASFEYTRTKVERDRFCLYLFAIKKRGVKFSQQTFQTWIVIFYWAHDLVAATDNINEGLSSFLTSPSSVLENALKLGKLLLFGASVLV